MPSQSVAPAHLAEAQDEADEPGDGDQHEHERRPAHREQRTEQPADDAGRRPRRAR